jgi:uncharacterized protein DUF2752
MVVWLPACQFHRWTGIACPTCGMTRAALALLEGRFLSAFATNPLAAAAGAFFLAGGLLVLPWAAVGWPLPVLEGDLGRRGRIVLLAVLLVNWIYLIVVGV